MLRVLAIGMRVVTVLVILTIIITSAVSEASDLYWDTTDSVAPLAGSSSTLDLSGSYFSTAASGDTALTNSSSGDSWYFQTDTVQAYTCNVDAAQTITSLTVSNGNNVTIQTSVGGNSINCSNTISVTGGSSLKLKQISNALILDTGPKTVIALGAGDNTFTIEGSAGSSQFHTGGLTGDAGDRIIFDCGGMWIRNYGASDVFGGELIGNQRLSPGNLTLTGDNPNFSGSLEGGTVTLGDGGTSGTMGSARRTALGTMRFNRSDDYTFTNDIATGSSATIANDGTGKVTIPADITVNELFFAGDNVLMQGNINVSHRLWFNGGAGRWILTGTNSAGGSIYNAGFRTSSGSALQLGDGTSYAKMSAGLNCSIADNSDLIMDLTGGAQLAVNSNLVTGTGCNLEIIGSGQEEPIITCSNSVSSFENVVYNGYTSDWASAQVPFSLRGPWGRTHLRIDGTDIYIDPPPPQGAVLVIR